MPRPRRARLEQPAAFRAAGNVAFTAAGAAAELTERIEAGLAEALGYEVSVFLRDSAQVRAIAALAPFAEEQLGRSAGKLQVALLARPPAAGARRRALELASEQDPLVLRGRELYWLPRARMADSALDLTLLERIVGRWTMRTKATVELLAAKHFGGE